MKWKKLGTTAKNRIYIYVFFLPMCWCFIGTIANFYNIGGSIFGFANQRSVILTVMFFIAVFYIFIPKWKLKIDRLSISCALLTLYMFLIVCTGKNIDNFFSAASCVVLWAAAIIINRNIAYTKEEKQFISALWTVTCIIMSGIYTVGRVAGNAPVTLNRERQVGAANSIQLIVTLLPFVLMAGKKLRLTGIFMALIAVVVSGKSSCVLACILIACYAIVCFRDVLKKRHTLLLGIAVVAALYGLFWMIATKYLGGRNMMSVINELYIKLNTGGSGRTEIWRRVFELFRNSSAVELIVGRGFSAAGASLGIGAHNDFMEILLDYGIVGLMLYLWFWYQLILNRRRYQSTTGRFIYDSSIIIFLVFSMVSAVINSQIQLLGLCFFWGIYRDDAEYG